MIYRDLLTLHIDDAGTISKRDVYAVATFIDSVAIPNLAGGTQLLNSRFRFIISPAGDPIPALGVTIVWPVYRDGKQVLVVEGLIEPHYLHGRLHHYEAVARDV